MQRAQYFCTFAQLFYPVLVKMRQQYISKKKKTFHTRFIAIVSIALPLFTLAWIGVVEAFQRGVDKESRENLTFLISLDKDFSQEQSTAFLHSLQRHSFVKDARYISPEDAAKELEQELGENPETVLGYNPLSPSIELHLKAEYTHPDSLPKVDALIEELKGVDKFMYRSDMFDIVYKRMEKSSYVLWAISLLLLIMAIIQINNTTHLMIYSKRFLIRSMTLLGAERGLICRPFIVYSMGNGLLGACFAIAFFFSSVVALDYYLHLPVFKYMGWGELGLIAAVMVLVGVLLSTLSSFFSTLRYIRMDKGRIVLS